ncbi:hypothetical protein HU200_048350 [Digitaria exilis]|uniref:Uncharacterized protein n=1 Tax=Digitaria exilis TaxID=1010633 RepID=A0A835ED14_9POAL|nr:hypothetical protein HU200_048350 [Digitaria exilis]
MAWASQLPPGYSIEWEPTSPEDPFAVLSPPSRTAHNVCLLGQLDPVRLRPGGSRTRQSNPRSSRQATLPRRPTEDRQRVCGDDLVPGGAVAATISSLGGCGTRLSGRGRRSKLCDSRYAGAAHFVGRGTNNPEPMLKKEKKRPASPGKRNTWLPPPPPYRRACHPDWKGMKDDETKGKTSCCPCVDAAEAEANACLEGLRLAAQWVQDSALRRWEDKSELGFIVAEAKEHAGQEGIKTTFHRQPGYKYGDLVQAGSIYRQGYTGDDDASEPSGRRFNAACILSMLLVAFQLAASLPAADARRLLLDTAAVSPTMAPEDHRLLDMGIASVGCGPHRLPRGLLDSGLRLAGRMLIGL